MSITLRPGTPADAAICYRAFKVINDAHNFPPDFPSPEIATAVLGMLLSHKRFYSVVAERDGKIVGSNFLDERGPIAGVGPITVDPHEQNQTIGRSLMLAVLERATSRHAPGKHGSDRARVSPLPSLCAPGETIPRRRRASFSA